MKPDDYGTHFKSQQVTNTSVSVSESTFLLQLQGSGLEQQQLFSLLLILCIGFSLRLFVLGPDSAELASDLSQTIDWI